MSTITNLPRVHLDDLAEDDDVASSRRRCVGCGQLSPPTRSEHTLISAQHGWRLLRVEVAGAEPRLEWRCPPCWQRYRQRKLGLP